MGYFKLPYARTCHSYQGITEEKPICIFDVKSPLATVEWIYTAITRTVSLKNVSIFWGCTVAPDQAGGKMSDDGNLTRKIQNKIESYRKVDKEADRLMDDYIDVDWVLNRIKGKCSKCKCEMCVDGLEQFTVHRLDNHLGHTKYNCCVICLRCNISTK